MLRGRFDAHDLPADPAPANREGGRPLTILLDLRYRLLSRCWACHGLVVLHSPARLRRCEDTPPAIVLTDSDHVPASQATA